MKLKRYGKWSGNPNGFPENITKCQKEVVGKFRPYQCSRPRGHGPDGNYCKQHAKMLGHNLSNA